MNELTIEKAAIHIKETTPLSSNLSKTIRTNWKSIKIESPIETINKLML